MPATLMKGIRLSAINLLKNRSGSPVYAEAWGTSSGGRCSGSAAIDVTLHTSRGCCHSRLVKATGTLLDHFSIPLVAVDATNEPRLFFAGQLYDNLVGLWCEKCARKGVATVLGKALTKEGVVYFFLRENARRAKVVIGFPELDRMGDGRVKVRNNWRSIELIGDGFQLRCANCRCKPVVNAQHLADLVGEAMSEGETPLFGRPILIDPFGGFEMLGEDWIRDDLSLSGWALRGR